MVMMTTKPVHIISVERSKKNSKNKKGIERQNFLYG
jgi:hypothetical protein